MDRQDAVVGRRGDQPAPHLGKVVVEAVGALPGLVGAGAVALEVVGDDARRREGDIGALDGDTLRAARLLAVHAEAGGDGQTLALQLADVLKGLLQPFEAVVHRVVVGERQQVEAARHEMTDAVGMGAKVEGRALLLQVGREIVAIGHDRLDIREVEVAVDLVVDQRGRLRPGLEVAAANAVGLDRLVVAAVARCRPSRVMVTSSAEVARTGAAEATRIDKKAGAQRRARFCMAG